MNFETACDRVLGHEGKYVNNPTDPGGETNWGISKRSYPYLDIKNLTRDQAKMIYYTDFWQHIHADEMYDGVVFQVFEFAVNSGISNAVRALQRAVLVAPDGYWGPVSRAAVAARTESDVIMQLVAERLDFWAASSTWATFGKGWARRAAQDLRYGAVDS